MEWAFKIFFRQPRTRHIIVKNTFGVSNSAPWPHFVKPRVSFFPRDPNHGMGYSMNRQPDIDVYIVYIILSFGDDYHRMI